MSRPVLNVTPLIDILLVLLIIFMVVSPAKPTAFQAKVPSEPTHDDNVDPNPDTLVVAVSADGHLRINKDEIDATTDNADAVTKKLVEVFKARAANAADGRGERTVSIKAPTTIDYGKVVKVVDAVKLAGAEPLGLQIDDLVD